MVHRDLKPENILLESSDIGNLQIKIADFGFSCLFDPKLGLDKYMGTVCYMAPEIIKNEKYNKEVDIWSIGVIAYMLITGKMLFPVNQDEEMIKI